MPFGTRAHAACALPAGQHTLFVPARFRCSPSLLAAAFASTSLAGQGGAGAAASGRATGSGAVGSNDAGSGAGAGAGGVAPGGSGRTGSNTSGSGTGNDGGKREEPAANSTASEADSIMSMLTSTDAARQLHAMRLVVCVLESVKYTVADLEAEGARVEAMIPVRVHVCVRAYVFVRESVCVGGTPARDRRRLLTRLVTAPTQVVASLTRVGRLRKSALATLAVLLAVLPARNKVALEAGLYPELLQPPFTPDADCSRLYLAVTCMVRARLCVYALPGVAP